MGVQKWSEEGAYKISPLTAEAQRTQRNHKDSAVSAVQTRAFSAASKGFMAATYEREGGVSSR